MHSIISTNMLSFEYSNGKSVFKNINLNLQDKNYALVGPNGLGKTTLANLFAGKLEPTFGAIKRNSEITYFTQLEPAPDCTVFDYITKKQTANYYSKSFLSDIKQSEYCSHLSGGQWMRVRLSTLSKNTFWILDEPSNDLDSEGKDILIEMLSQHNSGFLVISHDREVLGTCDSIIEISNQGVTTYGMNWSAYEKQKNYERENSLEKLDQAKNEREAAHKKRDLEKSKQDKRNEAGRFKGLKNDMPKILRGARKRQAQKTTGQIDVLTMQNIENKIHLASQKYRSLKIDPVIYVDLFGEKIASQKVIAEAQDYNIYFDRWIFKHDLNFSWKGNCRIALKGKNGSGKTSLIKAILKTHSPQTRGSLNSGNIRSVYLDQKYSTLDFNKSIIENVRMHSDLSEVEIRNQLAKLLFTGDQVFQIVNSLSGGEKLRCALACGLLKQSKPELLILDEPTNNLDLQNIVFLENLLREFPSALIIVSHDQTFLKNCEMLEEFSL